MPFILWNIVCFIPFINSLLPWCEEGPTPAAEIELGPGDGVFDEGTPFLFGEQVDVSGDTLVVGSTQYLNAGKTKAEFVAQVYNKVQTNWVLRSTFMDGNPDANIGTEVVFDVALDGDNFIVSAPDDDDYASVETFLRDSAGAWSPGFKIEPVNKPDTEAFGHSLSLSGDTAAIGAPKGKAVYVYKKSGASWTLEEKIVPADGGESFGWAVSLEGNTLAVAAKGSPSSATYVYVRNGSDWSETDKIYPDAQDSNPFITDVSVRGNTLAIGTQPSCTGCDQAQVYIYSRRGLLGFPLANWSWNTKITYTYTSTEVSPVWLGLFVAFASETRLVIGAPSVDALIYYAKTTNWLLPNTWSEKTKKTKLSNEFAFDVAADGNTAIISAHGHENGGAAYVYDLLQL